MGYDEIIARLEMIKLRLEDGRYAGAIGIVGPLIDDLAGAALEEEELLGGEVCDDCPGPCDGSGRLLDFINGFPPGTTVNINVTLPK